MRNDRRTKLDESKPQLNVADDVAWRTRKAARDRRHPETPSEALLWQVRGRQLRGLKFRRQQPIGPFVADFYCAEVRLVVEIDGNIHDSREAQIADLSRQEAIEPIGIRVLRVRAEDVLADIPCVLARIATAVDDLAQADLLYPPEGEAQAVRAPRP